MNLSRKPTKQKRTSFWKIILILLGLISLSTGILKVSGFWTSYVLDIAGPAWIYVLIRVKYRGSTDQFLGIYFSPELALFLIISICFTIEAMQFFDVYPSTFDPYDLLAYCSGILIFYTIDKLVS